MVYSVSAHPMNRECFMSSLKVSLSTVARMCCLEAGGHFIPVSVAVSLRMCRLFQAHVEKESTALYIVVFKFNINSLELLCLKLYVQLI